jgi:hypothetical protein
MEPIDYDVERIKRLKVSCACFDDGALVFPSKIPALNMSPADWLVEEKWL